MAIAIGSPVAPAEEIFDLVIVGAGVSGVGAGARMRQLCPSASFCILERRSDVGGTWDLFRYPGIRSDSQLWGYAYPFKPWNRQKTIAPGPEIQEYVRETVTEQHLAAHIRFNEEVLTADFASRDARWHLTTSPGKRYSCQFLFMCGGYYDYDPPFTPDFADRDSFQGPIYHPQTWPEGANYDDKKVVVIGSGATAATMIPVMAERASHVVMLQRSPSYMFSVPSENHHFQFLRSMAPLVYYQANRWFGFIMENLILKFIRNFPETTKAKVLDVTAEHLAGTQVDIKEFTPSYDVWNQRLCAVPDGDIFEAIKAGKASVVTGHIDRFTEHGVLLQDGRLIDADMIVTATGMNVHSNLPFGSIDVSVDSETVVSSTRMIYKGCMLSGVPNCAFSFGYLVAGAWTQKADLTAVYVCRLLNHMRAGKFGACCPERDATIQEQSMHDFSSTYLARVADRLPKAGTASPWDRHEDYFKDLWRLSWAPLKDGVLRFSKVPSCGAVASKPLFARL